MDPTTAIGLASSILTFIDSATKIVRGTYEVYQSTSGATAENVHVDTIVGDLSEITANFITDIPGRTNNEIALRDLASNCQAVSGKLQALLNTLKVSGDHTTWNSLKVKIKSMRKESEIVSMEKQLSDYRAQILTRLMAMLSEDQSAIKLQLDRLEDTTLNISSETAAQVAQLRQDVLQEVKELLQNSSKGSNTAMTEVEDSVREVRQSLKTLSSRMEAVPRENIILHHIYFSSMDTREDAIRDPEEGTFKWLLEEVEEEGGRESEEGPDQSGKDVDHSPPESRPSSPHSGKSDSKNMRSLEISQVQAEEERRRRVDTERRYRSRTLFLTWLRSGRGVFHISGKAGSGKSTLMKFLCRHNRTHEELERWAAEKKKRLSFASFYFWNAGDKMQKSLDGLYRSILFETLKCCPELIPAVFPMHWGQLAYGMFHIPGNSFSGPDIKRAFEMLTKHGTFPNYRFCFFIDGLDEYHGESQDSIQLAKSLQRWASKEDVKVCASSRPYLEFDKLAGSDQRFYLHELTRHDIYLFSRQMIEKDDNFDQIKDSYLRLVDKIVNMSQGVFLWARLVVSSLLAGMLRHDTIEVLENKLRIIPRDINELYDKILGSLEPDDQERAAKLLLVTAHYPFGYILLNSVAYGWIDKLVDPQFPPCDGNKPPSWRTASSMAEDVQSQLKGLTKGLLETTPIHEWREELRHMRVVQFFHRTVKDFVLKSSKLKDVSRQYPSLTDRQSYCRLLLADLTLGDLTYRRTYWNLFMVVVDEVFKAKLPLTLLDGFCRVLSNDEDDSYEEDLTSFRIFRGVRISVSCRTFINRMSFVHMAAFAGQEEYVIRAVSERPELLKDNGETNLLFCAAVGGHKDLTAALILRGLSPMDPIRLVPRTNCTEDANLNSIPVWLAVVTYMVGNALYLHNYDEIRFDIWELLLDADGVDARNCAFLFGNPVSHFITLEGFIQDFKPDNEERLLYLIYRDRRGAYLEGARSFVSRFTPFFNQAEPVTPSETSGYTRLYAKTNRHPILVSILYGGLKSAGFEVQLF